MAASHTIGNMQPFDEATETFTCYVERLELFFDANNINEDKKTASLLSLIGPKTYNLLRGLTSPRKPKDKTYQEIIEILEGHLSPPPLEIGERYKFHQRNQVLGEDINAFVASLKQMTEHCNFGEFLPQALRDRFGCGLANESISKKLLCERDLTLEKAVTIAKAMEQAGKGANASHQAHTKPRPPNLPGHISPAFSKWSKSHRHARRDCKFYNAICRICNKRGHISDICMSSTNRKKSTPSKNKPTHCVEQEISEGEEDEIQCLHIFKCDTTSPPILVQVSVEGSPVSMELDTGSSVSIIPRNVYESTCKHLELKPAKVKLRTVALFGRSWLRLFKLEWPSIKLVQGKNTALSDLTEKYQDVFSDELGCLKGYAAQLHVRDVATPVHQKHRTVPFAIRHQVETELENLEKQGIISPITNSEWATPVVPLVKKSGGIRLCGDFKVTLNPELVADSYPLPTLDDLQEKMNGGSFFSKLDLTKAYSQIPLDDSAKQFTTLTTHKGLYAYNRLPFGVASSAAIFQQQMDRIFKDLPQVLCYQDDILVTGRDSEEHLSNLEEVLRRLHANGLTAQREKCEFMQPSLKYLGHVIDKDHSTPRVTR
ncbi:uncharacterized protein K02A2.6-like [Nematostella vectensis]|uniref:uncharacterized protein K02A2.6-like n=1 Tax=Nematostella vectensis TaxID=45351 RepID=UPI0020774A0C|nr:uncharacterized protein K02A2.6-like [Nematostella vectensis]